MRRAPGLLVIAGAAAAVVMPAPAQAIFPGANGTIAFGWAERHEDELGQMPSTAKRSIDVARPGGQGRRSLRACMEVDGQPDSGDCSIEYLSPAWAPGGRRLAFDAGTRPDGMQIAYTGFDGNLVAQRLRDRRIRQVAPGGFNAESSFGASSPEWQPLPRRWDAAAGSGFPRGRVLRQVLSRSSVPGRAKANVR